MAIRSASGLTSTPASSPTRPAATSTHPDSPIDRRLLLADGRWRGTLTRPGDAIPRSGGADPTTRHYCRMYLRRPGGGAERRRVTIQNQAAATEKHVRVGLVPGGTRARLEFRHRGLPGDTRLRHRGARRLRLHRGSRGRRPQLATRPRALGSAARPAHRPSEPRAPRRPDRAGLPPVAPLGRAVHADRRSTSTASRTSTTSAAIVPATSS